MTGVNIYDYRPLPWISKSTLNGYDFCQHLFKLRYIDCLDILPTVKLQTGLNIHMVYSKFFKDLDYIELKKVPINYIQPLNETRVYSIILNTLLRRIPVDSREFKPYQILVENFALIETAHWIDLNRKYKECYSKVMKYFKPIEREQYKEYYPLKIFGTPDRIDLEEDDKVRIIYDYKTGHVPIAILEERGFDPGDPFSWKLDTARSRELHFYIILDMCSRGYQLDEDVIRYCNLETNTFPHKKTYFFDMKGKSVNSRDLYRIGIIYTGNEDRPYVPKKKPHLGSLKSVFRWIRKIREVIVNNGPYRKEPNYYRCRECNELIRKRCLDEEEEKTLFWKKEDSE